MDFLSFFPYNGGVGDLLVKNGLVVAEENESVCDIWCSGEKIMRVGKGLAGEVPPDCETIDASGMTVIPGGVDVHTHLNLDVGFTVASDDFYTGTVAAAFGGTTCVVDHPAFGPAGCSLDHQINKYRDLAEGRAVIDYGLHGVLQHVDDDVLSMMEKLAAQGITSCKAYMTYAFKLSDADLLRVLEKAKELSVMIAVHAENDGVISLLRERFVREGKTSPSYHPLSRPAECEAEAVNRAILLAGMAGDAPLYIVHLSSALGLEYVRSARTRGQRNLWAETCPQYLFLDDSRYGLPGAEGLKYLMCPPLRKKTDCESLWKGLEEDIDAVATDHCPFFFSTQKTAGKDGFAGCPSGVPGIEERIPLLFSEGVAKKRLSLRRFTELCATTPAKLFGLYPQKGVIREGGDADIVIIDPAKKTVLSRAVLHENTDYTAYEGFEVSGWPVCTVSRGEVIVRNGTFLGKAGRGRFIRRLCLPPKNADT
ncbi:MAG: dihydropyrimidinase [Treponema sp.]|jgi:dihydropyrimidinase|nr:dihydropyrimidinase [Treponema sp.]